MTIKTPIRCLMLLAAAFAISETALAQGQVVGTNTTTAELAMTADAQSVLNLDISTNAGAEVSGTSGSGLFGIDLGLVNGLGVGTPGSGVDVAVVGTGATYTTPITLTPTFSGFTTATAAISVNYEGASGNALGNAAVREGASATVAAITTTPASILAAVSTGVSYSRYVGFFVSNENGAGAVEGALQATIVYTIVAAP